MSVVVYLHITNQVSGKTAILIFTRTAAEEAVQKSFVGPGSLRANTLIAASLIRHTVETVKASGIPFFTVYSDQQHGIGFGQRLTNAMADVFELGFEQVIAIGNDSPDLTPGLLVQAQQQLTEKGVVYGPAQDGGVYLIGVTQQAFSQANLVQLPWKTSGLIEAIEHYATQYGFSTAVLFPLQDIDKQEDFTRWLFQTAGIDFLALRIKQLIRKAIIGFASIKTITMEAAYLRPFGFRSPTFMY